MTYHERYQTGELAQVWDELSALGAGVCDAAVLPDALTVARATMERVAANIDMLTGRLRASGYEFDIYPDGLKFRFGKNGRAKPSEKSLSHLSELEGLAGPIPLSLKVFWEIVGSVSLIGRLRGGWLEYSDPLYVEEPWIGIVEFREWQEDALRSSRPPLRPFLCPIAPDVQHKDNVSGGSPYSIRLPDRRMDATVRDEWHNVGFVRYLRIAILEWGGFPGLSEINPQHQWRSAKVDRDTLSMLAEIKQDLIAF